MYSILIALAAGVLVGTGGALLGLFGWFGAVFFGLLASVVVWILLARRIGKRLQPAMERVRKQSEAGHLEPARTTLRELLPIGRWIPMLTGQLHAQIGVLAHYESLREQAQRRTERAERLQAESLEHLGRASRRAAEAQLLLAVIRYRQGDADEAFRVLDGAGRVNRRHALLHNVHAFLLEKEGRRGEAMARLGNYLKKDENNAATKDNLIRLQNDRKMNMKPFGMEWYALGFERPPASFIDPQAPRKGFRQPPKRRGRSK